MEPETIPPMPDLMVYMAEQMHELADDNEEAEMKMKVRLKSTGLRYEIKVILRTIEEED